LEVSYDGQMVGLDGRLAIRSPRDVRCTAKLLGKPTLDLGSNDRDFWLRLQAEGAQLAWHGRWLAQGPQAGAEWPGGDGPDALLDVLCLRPLKPSAGCEVRPQEDQFALLLPPSVAPNGQAVRKSVLFERRADGTFRPTAHLLADADGKLLRRATLGFWL